MLRNRWMAWGLLILMKEALRGVRSKQVYVATAYEDEGVDGSVDGMPTRFWLRRKGLVETR